MKVLLINGSPHPHGNTNLALEEVAKTLKEEGVDSEILWIGTKAIQGCIGCYRCRETGVCVFPADPYTAVVDRIKECDALVVGSPVYYAGPNGSLCSLLDRVFYSAGRYLTGKPAASVAVCRRGGASATFDRLNKYFTINCMPVVSSQYWNMVYGRDPGDAAKDEEGMQTMRTLARNMAWMLRKIAATDEPMPEREPWTPTNFIR